MLRKLVTLCSFMLLLCSMSSSEVIRFNHLFTINGLSSEDNFGCYVSPVGKWATPGADYLAVGAPGFDAGSEKGSVTIWYNNTFNFAVKYTTFIGENAGDEFGDYITNLKDISGDGKEEMLVGAPHYNDEMGKVYVYAGGTIGSATSFTTPFRTLLSPYDEGTEPEFGEAIGSGHVSNTTDHDIIVGAPGVDSVELFKWVQDTGGWDYQSYRSHAEDSGSDFGRSVAVIGDVNNDGYGDYVVGAPDWKDPLKNDAEGKVIMYSGFDGSVLWTKLGELVPCNVENCSGHFEPRFGYAVSKAGDWNSDGIPDVLVGAYRTGGPLGADGPNGIQGKIYIYSGDDDGEELFQLDDTADAYAYLGYSVAGGEDIDSDGKVEIIVGACGVFNCPTTCDTVWGKVYVFAPKTGDHTKIDTLFAVRGTDANTDLFLPSFGAYGQGYDVNFAGDIDGDGRQDIVMSGPFIDHDEGSGDVNRGQVKVYTSYYLGDANNSQFVSVSDVVYLARYISDTVLYPAPIPWASGDVDENGCLDGDDVDCLIAYIFSSGPLPCSGSSCP